ncbi:MAG: class I SAM-dependent methyltransferase [Bacteroidales bacterium]|nr:class I SAM-dependent methyltransferase [Bacteroidales bacterium]
MPSDNNNNNAGKVFDIKERTQNTDTLQCEYESYYKDKDVNFVKSYYAEDGINEWKDPTTSRKVFFEILKNIKYSGNEVFMDCGCGLGHIVYLASKVFSKVIGVELLQDVFVECQSNLKKLQSNNNVVLKNCDMFDVENDIIDSVNIFYFSSPFDNVQKFNQWIEKITFSYYRRKRKILFIYYYPRFEGEMIDSIFSIKKIIRSIGKVNIYSVGEEDNIPQIEISENDNPSKERILENFYRCRDFELSSFWQKSIFLFGFLSLCFAGYGALLLKTADNNVNSNYLYECMLGICVLGIVLSYIWIAMCKGSKAWYEVYEKTIYQLETEIFSSEKDLEKYVEGLCTKQFRDKMDMKLFNNYDGGQYSPSKINILIGDILLIIWILCAILCVGNIIGIYISNNTIQIINYLISGLIIIGIGIVLYKFPRFLKEKVKSSVLSEKNNS